MIEAAANVGLRFDDLPSGIDFVETPRYSDGFLPYQPIASSIEIATTDFAIL